MPMITGMAIDKVGDFYLLTAQVIVPKSDGGGASINQLFVNSAGKTVFDAVRDFIMKDGEKVFFGHLGFLIISNEIAQNDISEIIDFLLRDDEVRPSIYLLISDENVKASELLTIGLNNDELSFYIPNAFENVGYVSKFNPVTLENIVECIRNKNNIEIIPILGIEPVLGNKRVIINDGAIIKQDKVIGIMSGEEVKIVRLIKGEEKEGVYVINFNDNNIKSKVSLGIISSNSKIKVEKEKETFLIKNEINIKANIKEIINNEVKVLEYEKLKQFVKVAEEEIEIKIENTVKKTQQEYCADVFGFGKAINRKYPKIYKEISDEWDSIFTSIKYEVDVNINIVGSDLTEQVISK